MIRIIGDIHGNVFQHNGRCWCDNPQCVGRSYNNIVRDAEYSIQLGDLSLKYDYLNAIADPNRHKVVGGNHDNMDDLPKFEHYLGDFGTLELGGLDFFFIRGGLSVDKEYRVNRVSWWEEEELGYKESCKCIKLFGPTKPEIVVSHDCPMTCYYGGVLTNPTKKDGSQTARLLESCLNAWQPKMWFFGHHHKNWVEKIGRTTFVCLNELCYVDVDETIVDKSPDEIRSMIV